MERDLWSLALDLTSLLRLLFILVVCGPLNACASCTVEGQKDSLQREIVINSTTHDECRAFLRTVNVYWVDDTPEKAVAVLRDRPGLQPILTDYLIIVEFDASGIVTSIRFEPRYTGL
jgi:hypothetical protein